MKNLTETKVDNLRNLLIGLYQSQEITDIAQRLGFIIVPEPVLEDPESGGQS